MGRLASSIALAFLLLAASAAADGCPDPEAHTTVIMNVQDETARQALTASVNVTSFVLMDVGEEYITLSWMPAKLTEHAAISQVCTYMLTFNYLGVASSTGGRSPPPPPPVLPQAAAAAGLPRGPFSMHTVQYTNNTIATHHGLPPSTPVQVALHVCLLVNASTMVCVHVATMNATTSPLSGTSLPSRPSAATTTSVAGVANTASSLSPHTPPPVASQPRTLVSTVTAGPAESDQALASSSSARHTVSTTATSSSSATGASSFSGGVGGSDGSDGHVSSGMAGVAIVAATVIVLTAVGVAGASYLVYRHCRTRWEPLPSHFWTIELQAEYDSVSFTDGAGRADVSASSGGGSSSGGSSGGGSRLHTGCVRPAGSDDDDGQRCRLLNGRHDSPYKLLTA